LRVRKRGWIVGIAAAVVMAGATCALATDFHPTLRSRLKRFFAVDPRQDPKVWPNPSATLKAPDVAVPDGFGTFRVFVDPGHGAKGNTGNLSCRCEDEQDFTLALGEELGDFLRETGHFEVMLSRRGTTLVPYPQRVDRANAWGAHVFISLHSDVRGHSEEWSPESGQKCPSSEDAPGFSVLWSDEGSLAEGRRGLARAAATAMLGAGFLAYDGAEYRDMYDGDATSPGVFVDRHATGKRIFVLRKPKMPSIIVETHNAWDPREAQRWAGRETRQVFHATVYAALVAFLENSRDGSTR